MLSRGAQDWVGPVPHTPTLQVLSNPARHSRLRDLFRTLLPPTTGERKNWNVKVVSMTGMLRVVQARVPIVLVALLGGGGRGSPSATRSPRRPDPTRSLAFGAASDVEDILRANGVTPPSLTCTNPKLRGGAIRAVSCVSKLGPADLATLTRRVPLKRGPPMFEPPGFSDSCEATHGLGSHDRDVTVLVGQNTRVTNGVSRVAVHIVRTTGAACIEIEYPWST
jgi:hypothetical protein